MEVEKATYRVKVKWGKQMFKDVELSFSETDNFEEFFFQLYSLSMVPVDKQKVILKGKFLKVRHASLTHSRKT